MALCFSHYSNAQDYTTENILNNQWYNAATGTGPAPGTVGHTSGGPGPLWDPNQGILFFSYSSATAFQEVYVPNVFTGLGSGLQVRGYTYSYDIRNMNFDDRQGSTDTITATITLRGNPSSVILDTVTNTYNTKFDWTTFTGTRTLASAVDPAATSWAGIYFNSRDVGFWGGYYGPQVRNVSLRLNYGVDQCANNPLYASHCPGFNDIVTSGNLVPNTGAVATWGQSLDQTFAISTALQHGGLGVRVHGFQWGYDAFVANPYHTGCGFLCLEWRDPNLNTYVNITDSSGTSLYYAHRKGEYDDKEYWTSYNYSYTLPQTINSLNLGNFGFTAYTSDYAGIQNMYARILYTPDQCVLNPLYSTSCTGYQQAYFDQQCTINPLYDQNCTGYAQAYYTQQCSINALYDSGCPGYEQAYFTQQCTLNPLYSQSCPGYAQAYFDQQCSLNALYNTQCSGYAQAKALKDLQEQQTATVETSAVPKPSVTVVESSSPTVALADPTRTEAVVTTDVGGVELTVSGQISIPTGQPTATREAIKEATAEKKEEKKTVNTRALAVARAASKEAEQTALSTAFDAVALSQLDPTSSALGFGPGVNLQGNRGQGNTDNEPQTTTGPQGRNQTTDLQGRSSTAVQDQEVQQKNGPAVRNGGKVEGMEGGPDPTQLTRAPMDFNQYLQSQLQDSQFYTSKEIYKGQRTVDNARAERFLNGKSDVLHQRMIEQQYNIGN